MTVELDGNTVNNNGYTGLEAAARLATTGGSLHLTLTDNDISAPSPAFDYGAVIIVHNLLNAICLDSGTGGALANTIGGSGGYQGLAVIQNGAGIFRIEGLGSGTLAAVTAHLQAVNSATTVYADGTAFTPAAAGTCRSPGLPTLPSGMVLQEDLSGTQLVNLPAPGGRGRGLAYPLPARPLRAAADEVGLNLGVLPTGKTIRITFEAVVSASMPEGVFEISNQAQVAGSNFTPVMSDDPAAQGPANPTVTPVYRLPLARADSYATPEETPLTILAAAGVLANDLPSAGYTLTAAKSADPDAGTVDLHPDGSFTFTPPPNGDGPVTFQYTASDGIAVSPPAVVTVLITAVNDAPVLDNTGSLTLPIIFHGAAANPGITVSALLASGGGDPVSDTDPGALQGIAVIGVDSTHGTWQYTLNGQDWLGFNNPSSAQARLLAADGVARLRFLPQPGWSGSVDPGITFRAWDRTCGVQGETGDASQAGGSTAFSLAVETAAVSVQAGIDLALTVSAPPEPVMAGTNLTYTASLYNAGPSAATNVVLSSRLTTGLSFVTGSPDCSSAGDQVSCRLANLASGASADFSVTTQAAVDQHGSLTNVFEAAAAELDPNPANNTAAASITIVPGVVVYDSDEGFGEVWNLQTSTTSPCGERFLGEFENQTVTLALGDLPSHTEAIIAFDLYILRSWDGSVVNWPAQAAASASASGISPQAIIGPDIWDLAVDGKQQIHTTYSNWVDPVFRQAYPGTFPLGSYASQTGASRLNSLCYTFFEYGPMDAVYTMRIQMPHTAPSIHIDFSALGLQGLVDESWGLDNVRVTLTNGGDTLPRKLYIPLID